MSEAVSFLGRRTHSNTIKLDIRNGKISRYMGKTKPREDYDYAEGQVVDINIRAQKGSKGMLSFLDVTFVNGAYRFIVSTLVSSGAASDMVSRLANIQDFASTIRIDAWPQGKATKVTMSESGKKVPFVPLPRVQKELNGTSIKYNFTDRDDAIVRMVAKIKSSLIDAKTPIRF